MQSSKNSTMVTKRVNFTTKLKKIMTNPEESSNSNTESNLQKILDRLTKIEASLSAFANIQENLVRMQANIDAVVTSQTHINKEFEDNKRMVENLMNKNSKLEKQVAELTLENKKQEEKTEKILTQINDQDQYGRINMVDIIRGIPRPNQDSQEDTNKIACEVAKLMNIPDITPNDIEVSHRTSTRPEAAIIVKFFAREKKERFLKARKQLYRKTTKDLGYHESHPIYVNENLTQINGQLFKDTRDMLLSKENKLARYVWTKRGKTYVKIDEDSEAMLIQSKGKLISLKNKLSKK